MYTKQKLAASMLGLILAGVMVAANLTTGSASASQSIVFLPGADSFVSAQYPNTNFGTQTTMNADASPIKRSYLRFNLLSVGANKIISANLLIYVRNTSSYGQIVLKAEPNNAWNETTINYVNAPLPGITLASVPAGTGARWVSFNLSAYVKAAGVYTFVVTTPGSTNISMSSREWYGYKPKLFVVVSSSTTVTPSITPTPSTTDPVLVGAGDIADCSSTGDDATAKLITGISGTVFTTGDNVYEDGTPTEFANCYNPSWGLFKNRTHPAPGNHDYHTAGASGYYGYFGAAAGDPTKGYYSFNLGTWHIVVLNGEISTSTGSPQETWLRSDLAAHPAACTLAIWHEPLYSSGSQHGSSSRMADIWQDLYDYHADVVVNGHEHNYERFAPQNASGVLDPKGMAEFVVGTGGKSHYGFGTILPNSLVRNGDTYGVIRFTLHPTSYDFKFIPIAGQTFTDSGSAACH